MGRVNVEWHCSLLLVEKRLCSRPPGSSLRAQSFKARVHARAAVSAVDRRGHLPRLSVLGRASRSSAMSRRINIPTPPVTVPGCASSLRYVRGSHCSSKQRSRISRSVTPATGGFLLTRICAGYRQSEATVKRIRHVCRKDRSIGADYGRKSQSARDPSRSRSRCTSALVHRKHCARSARQL
jgi:hypothetical protein